MRNNNNSVTSFLKILLSIFLGMITVNSCKNSATAPTGQTGNIIGHIYAYDSLNSLPLSNESGFKISLEGTPYFSLTDSLGKWELKDIPSGTYAIIFSKDNYVTQKIYNLQIDGPGTLYFLDDPLKSNQIVMWPIPSLLPTLAIQPFVDKLEISTRDSSYRDSAGRNRTILIYDSTIIKSEAALFSSHSQNKWHGQQITTFFYFNKQGIIDPMNPNTFVYYTRDYYGTDTSGLTTITVLRSELLKAGFSAGDNINCVAFAGTMISNWLDYNSGKTINSGFSPHHSEVKSFILP